MACSPDGPVVIYKSMLIVVDITLGNMYTDVTINKDINYLITVHLRSYLHEHETPKKRTVWVVGVISFLNVHVYINLFNLKRRGL